MDPVRNFQNEGVDISDFHNFQTMAFCVVSLSFPLWVNNGQCLLVFSDSGHSFFLEKNKNFNNLASL